MKLCSRLFLTFLSAALLVSSAISRAPAAPAPSASSNIAGLYVYLSQVSGQNNIWDTIYNDALSKSYVDGATVVVKWSSVEPLPGIYDWSELDRWIVQAVELRKKLAIGIVAGAWTPDWLYQSGVHDNVFPHYDRSPPLGLCGTLHQPSVWSALYVHAYADTMSQLAKHLHQLNVAGQPQGAAYAALRIVKLSGINLTTEELRIDAHPPGGPCNEANSAAVWLKAGYTPAKILAAWMTIMQATKKVFPDKVLAVAIIHKDAFPPIDDDGTINTTVAAPAASDPMTMEILQAAVPIMGRRLLVQWNALSQFTRPDGNAVLPQEVLDAGANGARVGWQLNGFLGAWGGSGCVYRPFKIAACKTIHDFEAILDNGIDHGGRYIEIHPVTVDRRYLRLPPGAMTDYAPAYIEAHDRLTNLH